MKNGTVYKNGVRSVMVNTGDCGSPNAGPIPAVYPYLPVIQSAEIVLLKSIQYRFESGQGDFDMTMYAKHGLDQLGSHAGAASPCAVGSSLSHKRSTAKGGVIHSRQRQSQIRSLVNVYQRIRKEHTFSIPFYCRKLQVNIRLRRGCGRI